MYVIDDVSNDYSRDIVVGLKGEYWGKIFVHDGESGDEIWMFKEGGYDYVDHFYVTMIEDISGDGIPDVVYYSRDSRQRFYLFNSKTGEEIWIGSLADPLYGLRALVEVQDFSSDDLNELIVIDWSGELGMISGRSGETMWSERYRSELGSRSKWSEPPDFYAHDISDVSGDGISDIIIGGDGALAIDGVNGNIIWELPDITIWGIEVIDEKYIVLGTDEGIFYKNGRTGDTIWSYDVGGIVSEIYISPDISGDGLDDLLIGSNNRFVYALNPNIPTDDDPPHTYVTSIPEGTVNYNDVTITWSGMDEVTTNPNHLQFVFRLKGYNDDWTSWSSTTQASYDNLPNGEYTFEVVARDEAKNVDPTPVSLSFTIKVQQEEPKPEPSPSPEPEPEPEEQNFGTLRIKVYDEARTPLSGVTIYSTSQPEGQSSLDSTTSSDGEVTFQDVIAGEYIIQAMKQEYESASSTGRIIKGDSIELVFYLEETETEPEPEPINQDIPGYPTLAIVIGGLLSLFILKKFQS